MDAIRQQYSQFREAWDSAYSKLLPNPDAYQVHLAGASLEQLNEVVKTVGHWLDRTRAPKGFAPTFHLSRSLAATSLAAGTTAAQALDRGELGHFPAFVAALNQCVTAVHTALLFSEPGAVRETNSELSVKLSEGIALIQTGQRELASKVQELERATNSLAALDAVAGRIAEHKSAAEEGAAATEQHSKAAAESVTEARENAQELEELKSSASALLDRSKESSEALKERETELEAIIQKAGAQERLISNLLPKGASAGLASAFAGRVRELEYAKWIWIVLFLGSMGGLFYLALEILAPGPSLNQAFWQHLAQRLPLAAPMIWLGWFAAVQYGNSLRVQEDYAFKEATSKAFAGYRDHMDHLASVDLEEGNTAMKLMAQRTIEILANEPLRIFQDIDRDSAPTQGILGALRRGRSSAEPKSK